MLDTGERKRKVVMLLEDVLAGTFDPQKALEQWPDIDAEADGAIKSSWHALYHFMTDEDIQQKEPEYKQAQVKKLSQFIAILNRE